MMTAHQSAGQTDASLLTCVCVHDCRMTPQAFGIRTQNAAALLWFLSRQACQQTPRRTRKRCLPLFLHTLNVYRAAERQSSTVSTATLICGRSSGLSARPGAHLLRFWLLMSHVTHKVLSKQTRQPETLKMALGSKVQPDRRGGNNLDPPPPPRSQTAGRPARRLRLRSGHGYRLQHRFTQITAFNRCSGMAKISQSNNKHG